MMSGETTVGNTVCRTWSNMDDTEFQPLCSLQVSPETGSRAANCLVCLTPLPGPATSGSGTGSGETLSAEPP